MNRHSIECNYYPTRPLYVHLVACIQFLGKSKTQVCLENKSVFALMSDYSCDTLYFDIKANVFVKNKSYVGKGTAT